MDVSKVFKAYDVRAVYPDPLNEAIGFRIGYGTAKFLAGQAGREDGTLLLTRDMRPAAPSMAEAFSNGVRAAGLNVIDLGMCDTSFLYFAIPHLQAEREGVLGGAQCTASHNPVQYIGFKVSGDQAKPIGADTGLKEIEQIASSLEDEPQPTGSYEQMDLWDAYREHVRSFLAPLDRPVKLFVDASNGMATTLLPKVFEGVENLETTAINDQYTDRWAHEPNPLVSENVEPTRQGVKQTAADLGACFDGDADRCMLVDDQGADIGCDHLTALLAHHFVALARTDPAQPSPTTIVYDLRSSKVVEETVKSLGAQPKRSRVGHVFMKRNLRDTGGVFGGELSGHFYFRANNFADSGAITLAAVLSVLNANPGKSLSELIAPFRKYPQSGEINFDVDDKQGTMDAIQAEYGPDGKGGGVDHLDGVTLDLWDSEGYWFNVRPSNTEPLLRFNAEAKDRATLDALIAEITPKLGTVHAGH